MQMIQTASIMFLKKEKFKPLSQEKMDTTSNNQLLQGAREKILMAVDRSCSSQNDGPQHTMLENNGSKPLSKINILSQSQNASVQTCPIAITNSPPSEEIKHQCTQEGISPKPNKKSFENNLKANEKSAKKLQDVVIVEDENKEYESCSRTEPCKNKKDIAVLSKSIEYDLKANEKSAKKLQDVVIVKDETKEYTSCSRTEPYNNKKDIAVLSKSIEYNLKDNENSAKKLQEVFIVKDETKEYTSCSRTEPYKNKKDIAGVSKTKPVSSITSIKVGIGTKPKTIEKMNKEKHGLGSTHDDERQERSLDETESSTLLLRNSHSIVDDGNRHNGKSQSSNKQLLFPSSPTRLSPSSIIQSFVPGDLPNFWQCPQCKHLPLGQRPKHSVLYHYAPSVGKGKDRGDPPTSLVRPIIQLHFNACNKHNYRKALTCGEIENNDDEHGAGIYHKVHLDSFQNGDTKESNSDDDYVDSLDWNEHGARKIGRKRGRGQQDPHFKKMRREAGTLVSDNDSDYDMMEDATSVTESPSTLVESDPKCNVVYTPITNNGLAHPTKDAKLTATIDIILISQMVRCYYAKDEDSKPHLRGRNTPLPENFPGLECKYCLSNAEQQPNDLNIKRKMWFFRNAGQVAMGLLFLEKHLMNQCRSCPKNVKSAIRTAKHQERHERLRLRKKTGEKVTRKEYASAVFKRLGFGVKRMD